MNKTAFKDLLKTSIEDFNKYYKKWLEDETSNIAMYSYHNQVRDIIITFNVLFDKTFNIFEDEKGYINLEKTLNQFSNIRGE